MKKGSAFPLSFYFFIKYFLDWNLCILLSRKNIMCIVCMYVCSNIFHNNFLLIYYLFMCSTEYGDGDAVYMPL